MAKRQRDRRLWIHTRDEGCWPRLARPLPPGTVGAAQARRTQRRHRGRSSGTANTQACFEEGWGREAPGWLCSGAEGYRARVVDMRAHSRYGAGGSARTQPCTLRGSPSAWQAQQKGGSVPGARWSCGAAGHGSKRCRTSNAKSPCANRLSFACAQAVGCCCSTASRRGASRWWASAPERTSVIAREG